MSDSLKSRTGDKGTVKSDNKPSGGSTGGSFNNATITNSTFTGGSISGSTITNPTLSGGTITGTAISGGTVNGTAITGSTFTGGTIVGPTTVTGTIDFSGATVTGIPGVGIPNFSGAGTVLATNVNGSYQVLSDGYLKVTYIAAAGTVGFESFIDTGSALIKSLSGGGSTFTGFVGPYGFQTPVNAWYVPVKGGNFYYIKSGAGTISSVLFYN